MEKGTKARALAKKDILIAITVLFALAAVFFGDILLFPGIGCCPICSYCGIKDN